MKNWLSFKRQSDGSYLYAEEGLEISYTSDGLLRCVKNGKCVFEKQYEGSTQAMMNAADVYEKHNGLPS